MSLANELGNNICLNPLKISRNIHFVCIFSSMLHLSPSVNNVPDVLPHPTLRSGQPCPLDWPAPSPTTVAARVSCRALRPVDEWCDPSKAGEPQGWQPGSSCCWGSACGCYLSLIPEPASFGPSRTYLRSKQRDTQQESQCDVSSVIWIEKLSQQKISTCVWMATQSHKTRGQRGDYNWSDKSVHIRWQYRVIAQPTYHP